MRPIITEPSAIRASAILLLIIGLSVSSAEAKRYEYHLDEVYPIGSNGTIILDTGDAEIRIEGTDRSDVRLVVDWTQIISGLYVKANDEPFEMEVRPDGDNLRIREIDGGSYMGIMVSSNEHYEIVIEAPKGVSLKLNGDDDNYSVTGIDGSIDLSFDDGRAYFGECGSRQFDLECNDGTIELEGGAGTLYVTIDDGRIIVEEGNFRSIEATINDGEIDIATSLADKGDYRLRCDDGRVVFTVLEGGGEFTVDYDDGHVRAASSFDLIDKDEGYEFYKLDGGSARVRCRIEDGYIRLNDSR